MRLSFFHNRATVPCLLAGLIGAGPSFTQDELGQTPRPKAEGPVRTPTDKERVQLDRTLDWFKVVADGPFRLRGKLENLSLEQERLGRVEEKAYNYVLSHASKQPLERLREYADKDVPIANLFADVRLEYRSDLLHYKGVLRDLQKLKPTDDLRGIDEIQDLYEAWIVPDGASNFVCLVVSELPEGMKTGTELDRKVAFDAFYFKHYHYETREKKADGKHQWRAAPLFLGRSFEDLGPPDTARPFTGSMLAGVLGGLTTIILIALGLGLWFRRGDRHVRSRANNRIHEAVTFDNVPGDEVPVNRISEHL